jgi:RNA processing factor Prp31
MEPTEPVPPTASRADALGRLRRELWHAHDAGETQLAAQLQQRIARLSADSSATSPQRETTAAQQPRRETNSRPSTRSPRVPRN